MTTDQPHVLRDADDVDLVVVSTPPNTHGQWALDLIESGKHVVLEKPMALTTEECDAAIEAARRSGKTLVVYQNRRFDADFRASADIASAGERSDNSLAPGRGITRLSRSSRRRYSSK
jgi:predicted dehydrogenase